jgi:hypothetical protein
MAVEADPNHATARGLLIQIANEGSWQPVEAFEKGFKADTVQSKVLAEYKTKRLKTLEQPDEQTKLADWCQKRGLKGEAEAHLTVAARLAPRRADVWQRLGYRRYHGRWLPAAHLAALKAEVKAQKEADKTWQPRLESLAKRYFGPDSARDQWAEEAAKITDPRAVPAIWRVFARSKVNPKLEEVAVDLLDQVKSPLATQRLALLAVFNKSASVRSAAAAALLKRDPRDCLDLLIGLLNPLFNQGVLQDGRNPRDAILVVEGQEFTLKRLYESGSGMPFGAARQAVANGQAEFAVANRMRRAQNEPVLALLRQITGEDPGGGRGDWQDWWEEKKGYSTPKKPKPIVAQHVVLQPPLPVVSSARSSDCFGAGALVRTVEGLRPIESLLVGDRVLSQDPATGALSVQPIVAIFHNPPGSALQMRIGEETFPVTGIHRFWKAGAGWVMAKDLRPGDRVRSLTGLQQVVSVQDADAQPLFNLEVAGPKTFFVGQHGAFVHDYSTIEMVVSPFDGAKVAASTPGGATK